MTTKQEARSKIDTASRQCDRAHEHWLEAARLLGISVSVNGYGIFHDRGAPLRGNLLLAQDAIKSALAALDAVEWPTDADYDIGG